MILLQNNSLQVHIEPPQSGYLSSRFDWTGKIIKVLFKDSPVTGVERPEWSDLPVGGKGLFNEFGMNKPVGFEETAIGDWFQKIGVGLLKKEEAQYIFNKDYQVRPATFSFKQEDQKLTIHCESEQVNGYAYHLEKTIALVDRQIIISYQLHNTSEKAIITDEYTHNFLAIDQGLMGRDYQLSFPFTIQPDAFGETVNPEEKLEVGQKDFRFTGTPEEQFFFSNLSGNQSVAARWELRHHTSRLGIRERGSFLTSSVNLWGWKHVISPELFFEVAVEAGELCEWTRKYEVFRF